MSSLGDLRVLWLDAQATAASTAGGALVELGWASGTAAAPTADHEAGSCLVAPPPGAVMPGAVARLTGIDRAAWQRGLAPETAWRLLLEAAARVAPPPVPLVVHFARFEEPFLRALHGRHGSGPFPFTLVCTHAIARRLLPGLPRRTLRALAGYFGAAVPAPRRSADHVAATAVVWRHLVAALDGDGIADLAALREWLASAPPRPRRAERAYPLARERRRALPAGPGVYRLLREGGAVVYVGKAASLRQRVSGHYHSPTGERALEMLSQVRDVSCTETSTALEAALLEADEIKRLRPALQPRAHGRRTLRLVREPRPRRAARDPRRSAPDRAARARRGRSRRSARCAPRSPRAGPRRSPRARRRSAWSRPYAPDAERFAAGLARFLAAHGPLRTTRDVLRVGGRLWANRRTCAPATPEAVEERAPAATATRSRWDAEQVLAALEEAVLRSAHAVRRARWLVRLSECTLAWSEAATRAVRPGDSGSSAPWPRAATRRTERRWPPRREPPGPGRAPGGFRPRRLRPPARAHHRAAHARRRRAVAGAAAGRPPPALAPEAAGGAALDLTPLRVLFVSDTHLGFDLPRRPRVEQRRRGPDFFACFERALAPALARRGRRGGPRRRPPLPQPGPGARSCSGRSSRSCASPALACRSSSSPATTSARRSLTRCSRRWTGCTCSTARRRSSWSVAACAWPSRASRTRETSVGSSPLCSRPPATAPLDADARVLCIHQCVEGASCGPPPGYTFRGGDDVVAARATCRATSRPCSPATCTATRCCGATCAGGRCPRPSSTRARSSAPRSPSASETKGFVLASIAAGGRLARLEFRPLPARPMLVHDLGADASGVERELRAALASSPPDVVLQLRVPASLAGHPALGAGRLRALGGPAANLTVSIRPRPPGV